VIESISTPDGYILAHASTSGRVFTFPSFNEADAFVNFYENASEVNTYIIPSKYTKFRIYVSSQDLKGYPLVTFPYFLTKDHIMGMKYDVTGRAYLMFSYTEYLEMRKKQDPEFGQLKFFERYYAIKPEEIKKNIIKLATDYAEQAPRATYYYTKGEAAIFEIKFTILSLFKAFIELKTKFYSEVCATITRFVNKLRKIKSTILPV
jgi:hypothetical protein